MKKRTKKMGMCDYVASLEWSKKLQEAGVEIETEFYWAKRTIESEGVVVIAEELNNYGNYWNSPLTDELLEIMATKIGKYGSLRIYRVGDGKAKGFGVWYGKMRSHFYNSRLPDALAQLAIWVKENKHGDISK